MTFSISKHGIRAGVFLQLEFDQTYRLFGGSGTWTDPDGNVWTGAGNGALLSGVDQTEQYDARPFSVGYMATDVDGLEEFDAFVAALAATTSTQIRGKPVLLYLGIFDDETGDLINVEDGTTTGGALINIARGVGSTLKSTFEPGSARIVMECERVLAQTFPARSLFVTDDDQQGEFAGDLAFEFVPGLVSGGRKAWASGV